MSGALAFSVGGLVAAYLLLRLLLIVCRKLRRGPNPEIEIASMGILALAVCTVIGGYGMQDGGPEPVFHQAFYLYFGPAMAATVIELVRVAIEARAEAAKKAEAKAEENAT